MKIFIGLFATAWLCVTVVVLGFGSRLVWRTVSDADRRTSEYAHLLEVGVPVTGHLAGCSTAPRLADGRGGTVTHCYVYYRYENVSRNWEYDQASDQFTILAPGAPVDFLVDPAHPRTEGYTVHDVRHNTNTSWVTMGSLIGAAITLFGLALVGVPLFMFLT